MVRLHEGGSAYVIERAARNPSRSFSSIARRDNEFGLDEMRTLSKEKPMTVAIYICSAALLAVLAIAVYNLESWLERWDYKRHLED
jgi:hypothetical protein